MVIIFEFLCDIRNLTSQGFRKILAGDYDNLPEVAFYMVGPIEEVVQKAEKLAAESSN